MATALEKIVQWAQDLPDWQSDAVRRLLLSSSLTQSDKQEIISLLKAKHGLADPKQLALLAKPFKAGDLSGAPEGGTPVALRSIGNIRNVNAIPDGSQMSFGQVGLTVIYGENGAGKSGFARVLKRACWARDASEQILPNMFTSAPVTPASAEFHVNAAGVDHQILWHDGAEASPLLTAISVFDGRCARVIIDEDNGAQYLPYGAQVFEDLVKLLKEIRDRLQMEKPLPQKPLWPDIPAVTAAGKFLEGLTATTDMSLLGTWTDANESQFVALTKRLAQAEAEDPIKAAQRQRNLARRMDDLAAKLLSWGTALSTDAETALSKALKALAAANTALMVAPQVAVGKEPLHGVGSATWQLLYQAAREFSLKEAYAEKGFPELGVGARCPLCMQLLDNDAKQRLAKFRDYMEQTAKKAVEKCMAEIAEARQALPAIGQVIVDFKDALDELKTRRPDAAGLVAPFVEAAIARAAAMRTAEPAEHISPFPSLPGNPTEDITNTAKAIEEEATRVEKTADASFLSGLRDEKREKEARKTLIQRKSELERYIKDLKVAAAYDRCYIECDFRQVTDTGKRIVSEALTPELQKALARELKELGASHLTLNLKPVGAEGETKHRLQITSQRRLKASLTDILSEGEQRVVAIAGFLAELETAKHTSPIILDDPVSSLDHKFRLKTAERLVREAAKRQVIVFTHDLSFLMDLQCGVDYYGIDPMGQRRDAVDLAVLTIERLGAVPGNVVSGLPWCAAKVTGRINSLLGEVKKIEPLLATDRQAYNEAAARVYGRLRETWESFVEEVLFNGTIQRFQTEVKTQSLKEVTVTIGDAVAVDSGMTKASTWMTGHDKAKAINVDRPDPDQIRQDIQALQKLVAAMKKRHEDAKMQFKSVFELPSVTPTTSATAPPPA